jgi:uncharacterized protein YqgC (DUF456 family)
MTPTLLLLIGIGLIVLGVVGLVLPMLPGIALIYLGIFTVAWAHDFTRIGPLMLAGMLLLTLAATAIDHLAGIFGARKGGASGWGVFGAALGAVVGLFFGLPGVILGPAVGALAFEYMRNPDARRAVKAGAGSLLGFVLGVIAKAVAAFLLIGVALLAYVF